ncbi:hypothetical protein SUGI_0246790 [Cryptomeria japonica]|uniref:uncharacterized protein LOC131036017 n=1 Tax=Cryptomeria japonica TaxID=3369 RepID=UPI002408F16B|nr:uncharacterized protein LOC131036017 [Cryptomeria japonica]GLJ15100.1 hypothetical protein SUGI_0246790 [Cryptomeria japonica]
MAASIILTPSTPIIRINQINHRTTGYYNPTVIAGSPQISYALKSSSPCLNNLGRRHVLLSSTFPALLLSLAFFPGIATAETVNTRGNELIEKLLERSKANKAKYDKERLDDYYKRNYKEYFEFVEGTLRNRKGDLSEAEKGIIEWLKKNR